MSDDLVLKVNGVGISGWTSIRVTRGVERCPSDFDVEMTDLFPGQAAGVLVQEGDPCQVLLGGDLVMTGYVDKVIIDLDGERHSIRVTGRGKCQDLVDCSAEWKTGQMSQANALIIAQNLAKPYEISVTAPDGPGPAIPQFNIMVGETAYEIIERVCRFAGLLCYEGPDGNLILAQAGDASAASGVVEGQNLQAARAEYSQDQRYSEYEVFLLSMDMLQDAGISLVPNATASDLEVKRNRKLYVVADAGAGGLALAQARANWEANRRIGRGSILTLTADSWRDGAGALWLPNTKVPVTVPSLKYRWPAPPIAAEVTYLRDERGTRAELVLMPAPAFALEPILLQPITPDLKKPSHAP